MKPPRALIINPSVYDFACFDLFSKPLGALHIATALKRCGFLIDFIDCMDRFHPAMPVNKSREGHYYYEAVNKPAIFNNIPRRYKRYGMPPLIFKDILKKIKKPDIILVTSGMTYWYPGVFEAIAILRKIFVKTPIMLGGIYATLCTGHAQRLSGADSIFKGTDIKSIVSEISRLIRREFRLPSGYNPPAYELYRKLAYITLRTSSGCPFKCSYCAWHLLDNTIRQVDPDEIVRLIEYYYKKLRIKDFAFYDEAFLYKADKHIIRILEGILKKNIRASFHTPNGLHARFLTQDIAKLLKKGNFLEPRIGFESADPSRQSSTGGKVYNEELKKCVGFLKNAGYHDGEIGVYLLIGLPGQPPEEVEGSLRFSHSLGLRVHLEEYSPIPGTPDYEKSGFSDSTDPLLHNNSAFPLYGALRVKEFEKIKQLNRSLNAAFM